MSLRHIVFNIAGNSGDVLCETVQEVEKIVVSSSKKLYDELWISGADKYPCLAILLNGDLANIHYFAEEDGEMWQSVKMDENDNNIDFLIGGQMDTIPSYYVISLEKALEAVKQFCSTFCRPDCIEWEEL